MAELEALCMKCRHQKGEEHQMQKMTSLRVEKNEKGRYSARGQCGLCDANMFKFLSEGQAMKLKDEGVEYKEAA